MRSGLMFAASLVILLMTAAVAFSDAVESEGGFGITEASYDPHTGEVVFDGTASGVDSVSLTLTDSDSKVVKETTVSVSDDRFSGTMDVGALPIGMLYLTAMADGPYLYDIEQIPVPQYVAVQVAEYSKDTGKVRIAGLVSDAEAVEYTVSDGSQTKRGFLPVEKGRFDSELSLDLKNGVYFLTVYPTGQTELSDKVELIISDIEIVPQSEEIGIYTGDSYDLRFVLKGCDHSQITVESTSTEHVSVGSMDASGIVRIHAESIGDAKVIVRCGKLAYAEITVHVSKKPEIQVLNTYNFFIQITKDFDKADCRPYTEADLRAGITISAVAYNAAEALEKACREKGIDYSAWSGESGSQDLRGWITSMFGLKQYQDPDDQSLWTYWVQYKKVDNQWVYNQWTLGYYTDGGDFQIIWKTTKEVGESGKTEVKTDENGNTVTITTNSEKKEDGTTVSSKTETVTDKGGNVLSKTVTKTEERPDGSKTSKVEKTENNKKDDGTEVSRNTVTEINIDKDGNLSETETSDMEEKRPDGTVVKTNTENVVEKDSSGKVLNETRTEKTEETGAKGTVISESFEKKENGKSTESRNIVSKAADGSVETEVEATVVDGKVEKAESTTVIAPTEGKVGADAAKAAVERSEDAISRAGIDAKDVEKTFEVSGASVSVEPGALGAIADHGAGLRFSASEKDSVHLDGDACRSLSGEEGAIDLSMSEGQEKDLLDAQKGAVGDRFFIVLDAVVGDKRIHDLGGKASVSFGYTPAEGENVSKLRVWYVDDEGNRHVVEGSLYDPEMGGFTMELTHFSVYMVAEDSSAPSPEPEPSGDDDEGSGSSSIAIAAIAVVIIAAIVAVAVIRMRKA